MPKASKLTRMPLPPGDETPGRRLARIRRERGFTQTELAEKTGLIQTLVSDAKATEPCRTIRMQRLPVAQGRQELRRSL